MKINLKETFDRTTVLTILVIWALAFAFYWFQYRPTVIRKSCNKHALNVSKKNNNSAKVYTFYYDQCLHQKGLK